MKTYEVLSLPYQGAKEHADSPLTRLATVTARSYREACQQFARLHAWAAGNNIWRVRQVSLAQ